MSSKDIYGVINSDGVHIDISRSLKVTKSYATRNGYSEVSIRYNCGYIASVVARKGNNGKWEEIINN